MYGANCQTSTEQIRRPSTCSPTLLSWCNLSPAQLLMGRSLRTTIPQVSTHLISKWSYPEEFHEKDRDFKGKQKRDYDRHYRTSEMPDIPEDTAVWIQSGNKPQKGSVVAHVSKPRSYLVDTSTGRLQKNRSHFQVVPDHEPEETELYRIVTQSQTGTLVRPPDRFSPGREM